MSASVGNSSGRPAAERERVSDAVDSSDFSEGAGEALRRGFGGEGSGSERSLWRRGGGRGALRSAWVASSSEPAGRYSCDWAALMFSKAPSTAERASAIRSGMR